MKSGFLVAVGGAAIVIAGLTGCSSGGESADTAATTTTEETTTTETTTTETETASATAEAGATRVVIDGQEQQLQGTVVCSSMGGNMNIAIGEATTGIAAVVSEADPPAVQSVGLGNVDGVTLGFQQGTGQGNAEVDKDGNNYTIRGNATGVDIANPLQMITKPFEIEVACP